MIISQTEFMNWTDLRQLSTTLRTKHRSCMVGLSITKFFLPFTTFHKAVVILAVWSQSGEVSSWNSQQNGHLHGHLIDCALRWSSERPVGSIELPALLSATTCFLRLSYGRRVWRLFFARSRHQVANADNMTIYDNMHSFRKGRKTPKKCKTLCLWKSKEHGMMKPTWLALEVFYPCSSRPTSILTLTCPLTQVQWSAGMYFKSMPSKLLIPRQPG